MHEEKPYFELDRRGQLRAWVAGEMARGAGKAALLFIAVIVTIYVIYAVGLLLPEASKQAPTPYPNASIELPQGPSRLA